MQRDLDLEATLVAKYVVMSTGSSATSRSNWCGRPLRTFETLVELIGHTRTSTALRVKAKLDQRRYKTGVIVTRPRCATLPCTRTPRRLEL